MKTLLLIDANSIIHRAFHALPPLTAPDGRPSGALYGLASVLLKIFREDKPDYIAACFDRPEPTFREEKYKEYKAQRPPAPRELISQIVEAPNLFHSFGVKTFDRPGMEADDLIAIFAKRFGSDIVSGRGGASGLRVVILTGDLDTLQLVRDDKVLVRVFKKGVSETETYNAEAVEKRYGLRPEQMVDYKTLVGDPSDNIRGVPGVGPKTAQMILSQAGSLEEFFKHPEKYPKFKDKLLPRRREIELNRELVTLRSDGESEVKDIRELEPELDLEKLTAYFRGLGFETLIKRLTPPREAVFKNPARGSTQGSIF
jgi:DNA polymerase-1